MNKPSDSPTTEALVARLDEYNVTLVANYPAEAWKDICAAAAALRQKEEQIAALESELGAMTQNFEYQCEARKSAVLQKDQEIAQDREMYRECCAALNAEVDARIAAERELAELRAQQPVAVERLPHPCCMHGSCMTVDVPPRSAEGTATPPKQGEET